MKTGWQMEWENEVAYFAPLRAEFNTRAQAWAKAMEPWRKLAQQFGISMREATKNLQKLGKTLELYSKPVERR